MNIYNGNKINLKIAEEETLHHIALEQKNFTVSEIKLQATAHYLTLQKSRIFRALMIQYITEQEKQLAEIRNYHKHGVVLKSDVLRVELKLSRQKMSLVEIENDILIATQRLNIIIGEPDEKLISVSDEIGSDSLHLKSYEEYLAEAMEKSYENRISEHETKLRKIEFKNVRANVSPKIGMYGDFYYANPQIFLYPYNDHLYSLGLGGIKASFPISEIRTSAPQALMPVKALRWMPASALSNSVKSRPGALPAFLFFAFLLGCGARAPSGSAGAALPIASTAFSSVLSSSWSQTAIWRWKKR